MKKETKKNGLEFYSSLVPSYDTKRKGKKIAVYKKEYRWRIHSQGRIISAATEGYTKLSGASNNIKSILKAFGFAVGTYSFPDIQIKAALEAYKKAPK